MSDSKAAQQATRIVLTNGKYKHVNCNESLPNTYNATDDKLFTSNEEEKNTNNNSTSQQVVTEVNVLQNTVAHKSYVQQTLEVISENIFKFIATFLFAYASAFVQWLIPYYYIGKVINFIMNTFLYTFYVFSYRYGTQRT